MNIEKKSGKSTEKMKTGQKVLILAVGVASILLAPLAVARLQAFAAGEDVQLDRKDLVKRALAQGGLEVDAGWLAVKRSTDPAIIDFGRKMANAHDATNKRLLVIADKLGIAASAAQEAERMQKLEQLKSADTGNFDALFLKQQIAAHEDMAALFASALRDKSAPELASFARESLDMIKGHLDEAKSLQEKLG